MATPTCQPKVRAYGLASMQLVLIAAQSLDGFNSRHLHHFYRPSCPFTPMELLNVPGVRPGMRSRAGSGWGGGGLALNENAEA